MKNWIVLFLLVVVGVIVGNLLYGAFVARQKAERLALRMAKFAARPRIGFGGMMAGQIKVFEKGQGKGALPGHF